MLPSATEITLLVCPVACQPDMPATGDVSATGGLPSCCNDAVCRTFNRVVFNVPFTRVALRNHMRDGGLPTKYRAYRNRAVPGGGRRHGAGASLGPVHADEVLGPGLLS
jgi:hypothetical protein